MVLPEKTVTVTLSTPSVGKGLFFSTIRDAERTAFVLPPRYRGHEEAVVRIYRLEGGVQDAGLLKAWGTLRELFGGVAAKAQVINQVGHRRLVGRLARREHHAHRQSASADHGIDLGAQSATRTADGVIRAPFLPPAAC